MAKQKINAKRLFHIFQWELKKIFYSMRYPLLIWFLLDALILMLPASFCQYLDVHVNPLVNIVNLILGFATAFGLSFAPSYFITNAYRTDTYEKERTSDISIPARLGMRALACMIFGDVLVFLGYMTTWAFHKFADESHSYMMLELKKGPIFGSIGIALLIPILLLMFFLRNLYLYQRIQYFFPYFWACICYGILSESLYMALTNVPAQYQSSCQVIYYVILLIITIAAFLRCCHYEKHIYESYSH